MSITIAVLDPFDPRALALVARLDALMESLYPPDSNHLDGPEVLARENVSFLGAFDGDTLVGCGAVKVLRDDVEYGEVKRVFVADEARGRGLARRLMDALESRLVADGVHLARLEVGIHQPDALGLYRALGYVERGPFGGYQPDPLSVFMEKALAAG